VGYAAERAVSPSGELVWVVVDCDGFRLHEQASMFLAGLRARDLSVNTERVYAGRVALYLSYCASRGLEWADPGFLGLKGFQDWLVTEPLPARSSRVAGVGPRFRSRGTANAVMTSVCEFLRFGATHGWVPARAAAALSEPKFLRCLPAGYDPGEDDQYRQVMRPVFRFADTERGYDALSEEQLERILGLACHARDFFLILMLLVTGMRVGEALGLRREDMHLLASSRMLGCVIEGPHVHVRRRRENANGALAKSRFPRAIPVTTRLVTAYAEYSHERDCVAVAAGCDMVFVNLFREPLGAPMSYSNVKDIFDRLARAAGFAVRPHMFRHTAATGWVRAGVDLDVVRQLLGHVSWSSVQPYLHVNDRDKRDAVERVAAARAADR
jgi:integrase